MTIVTSGSYAGSYSALTDCVVLVNQKMADMEDFSEAVARAAGHRQAGRWQEAEIAGREALGIDPNHAAVWHLLGEVAFKQGKSEQAAEYLAKAIELAPNSADALFDISVVLLDSGKFDAAEAVCQRVLALSPNHADALNNLGLAFKAQGRLDDAADSLCRAISHQPDLAEVHCNLGTVYQIQGDLSGAVACYERALALRPEFVEASFNLGTALRAQGKQAEAAGAYRRTLELNPSHLGALNNLGNTLCDLGYVDDGLACYRRGLEIDPNYVEILNNLGKALTRNGQLDQAVTALQRAVQLMPNLAEAHSNLGNASKDRGDLDEACASYRRAVELKPSFAAAHSNLLFLVNFLPGNDACSILVEHRKFDRQHAEPLRSLLRPHENDRSPHRRLRIGYVSPHFRDHCQSFFTLPLFRSHDRRQFEVCCYNNTRYHDRITQELRATCDGWRTIDNLSDQQLAETIRADRIDILVDLTMHMEQNRLLAFARKPAPVQVAWLAYPGTTGLAAMDYRLTDRYLDPPEHDQNYSEHSIRLLDAFWCYDPLTDEPAVGPLPADRNGYVTFGCLNNFCKINDDVLSLWSSTLKAVPQSRLILLAPEGSARLRVSNFFAAQGVSGERISFVSRQPRARYLELYHQIDVALDTFPVNGHTTSLDSCWMGVPVITLVGNTAMGRGGLSILENLGLSDMIATTAEQYRQIAIHLAANLSRLRSVRSSLRPTMQQSPLMDAPRFAGNIESAYRQMWQDWCANNS